MYIVSNFRDYYDSALGLGIDKSIVYKREKVEIELGRRQPHTLQYQPVKTSDLKISPIPNLDRYVQDLPYHLGDHHYRPSTLRTFDVFPFLIGFCGKIYPGYTIHHHGVEHVFSLDALATAMASIGPNTQKWFHEKPWKFASPSIFNYQNCERFFNADHLPAVGELFQAYKVPVFALTRAAIWDPVLLTLNPVLRDYSFVRVVDPYTAFQELMMYLAGVLGVGEPETVAVSDKTLAVKHGFDDRSFKTLSPGKKFKRRSE